MFFLNSFWFGNQGGPVPTIDGQAPPYVGSGAQAGANSGGVSFAPALPTDWAVGDYHVLQCECEPGDTVSAPSGWTLLGSATSGSFSKLTVFGRFAQGGDTAPTVTVAGDHTIGRIHGFRGVDTSNPVDVSTTSSDGSTSITLPAVTTTGSNRRIVFMISRGFGTTYTNSNLNSINERADAETTVGSGGHQSMITAVMPSAGSTGTTAVTGSNGDGVGIMTLALKPALVFSAPTGILGTLQGCDGAWYDPSDFSTMFQDTAGTTPVTATGQSVALIRDKSGYFQHLTQATAANRPTLQQDGGGRYYLDFDGTNDSMDSSFGNIMAQPNTLSFALYADAVNGAAHHLFDGVGSSRHAVFINTDNKLSIYAGTTVAITSGAISASTPYVAICKFNTSSSTGTVNGTATGSINPNTQALDRFRFGCFTSGTAHFDGRLYGCVIHDKLLSGADETTVSDYLETACGASF